MVFFIDKGFIYEPYLSDGRHELMQKAMSFNDVAIASVKGIDYRIHFWYMSKDDGINIMKNSNLNEHLNSNLNYNFLLYIKMSDKTTYYKKK